MKNKTTHWKKDFFTIWTGQAISQLSSSILQMAIVWYLIANTNSPSLVALSGIMAFLPQGLLGLFIGVFIDRYNRKTIMILSDLLIALASLSLVLVGLTGEIPVGLILFVLFIRSVGTAFHTPTLQAVTPQLVPDDKLTQCAGYSQTLQSVSLIISPALAAILFSIWDLNYIILLDVLGALIALATLSVVKIPKVTQNHTQSLHLLKEAKEGIQLLKATKLISFMMIGAIFSFVYMPLFVLYPMMTLSYFNKSSYHAGLVEIVFGVGMLMGSIVLGSIQQFKNKKFVIGVSGVIMGVTMLISGILSPNGFILFATLSTILGFVSPFYQGLQVTVYQEKISEAYLGRVLSLTGSLMVIATPLGIFISGIASELIGVNYYFALSGGLMIITAFLYIKKK
ncbi:MAG: MFS transporter [Turicibacter sp.]